MPTSIYTTTLSLPSPRLASPLSDIIHILYTYNKGDGAVGKTALLVTFSTDTYPEDYVPTVFDNYQANFIIDDHPVSMGLWDTAGQEDYTRLRPLAYPNTEVFIVCFSIISPASFSNVKSWRREVAESCPDVPVILVGLKEDMRGDDKVISALKSKGMAPITKEQGMMCASEIGAVTYLECSAKTQKGVRDVFDQAAKSALKLKKTKAKAYRKTHGGCSIM
jgi:Ras-related C3 botulinum toxin substrate 1